MITRQKSISYLLAMPLFLLSSIHFKAEAQPNRIISADAVATEIIVALGAGDSLVGVDDSSNISAPDVPSLGYHRALAAEGMIALAPDLVVGNSQMGPPHVIEALNRSDIPILKLSPALTPDDLRQSIETLAAVIGQDSADNLLAQLEQKKNALNAARPVNAPKSAAFLLRAEAGKLRMAGTDTAGDSFIRLIGASNLSEYNGYRSLTPEAVLTLQPDIILFADTEGGDLAALLRALPLLSFSSAYQSNQMLMVNPHTLVAGISLAAMDEALRVRETLPQQ